ncbi:MAG: hypothetical protein GY702_27630 [Desulfobulbaceae bacterium]|nr:hypothetical protein [Desulfobulbaceae bacterium]
MSATAACEHAFLQTRPLARVLEGAGKNCPGAVIAGHVDADVLEYIQNDIAWEKWHRKCFASNFEANKSIERGEAAKRLKVEYVGYADPHTPPTCLRLNADDNLQAVDSSRVQAFVRALKKCNREWLHQLTERARQQIARIGMPAEFLEASGKPFLQECFTENAFTYVSGMVMKPGEREEAWHTDGGASVIHAGLTIFGHRTVEVASCGPDGNNTTELHQPPGSLYVGNFSALEHRVCHTAESAGCYGDEASAELIKIAIMLRADYFRCARAREINSTPGPRELFLVVNKEVAQHIAQMPFDLPSLDEVIAEKSDLDGRAWKTTYLIIYKDRYIHIYGIKC